MSKKRKFEKLSSASTSKLKTIVWLSAISIVSIVSLLFAVSSDRRYVVGKGDRLSEKKETAEAEVWETDLEIHERLFPTQGYRVYPNAKEVDWRNVLISDREWDTHERKTLQTALLLIATTTGEDDPVTKELLTIGEGSRIQGILPMDLNIAIGESPAERLYIDQMWMPLTKCIHIPRNRMGSLIQLASGLYHESFHVQQAPTMEASRNGNQIDMEIEAYEKQIEFNHKLKFILETDFKSENSQPRWLRELRLVTEECQRRIMNYRAGRAPQMHFPVKR